MSAGTVNPLLLLASPLGDDTLPIQQGTLHAIGLHATERLSTPFCAEITVVSTVRAIDPQELLVRPVRLTIRRQPGRDRHIHGVVRRMEAVGLARRDRWQYRLEVVPWLRFLDQTVDCRIFQQKSAVQILQEIFAEHRVAPVEFRIYGDRPVREYTTQYNETDLAFVERVMQESGYFYYFEHERDAHRLIVTDRNQAFRPLAEPLHRVVHEGENIDVLDRWSEALRTTTGAVRLQDYDPTRPSAPVQGEQATTLATAGAATRKAFHWPAMTLENRIAAARARFRIEADEARAALRSAHGYNPEFVPGARFTLARDPFTGAQAVDHAIHGVEHIASDDSWITGGGHGQYENHVTCLLQATPWREPLDLPRPSMAGLFSAIVLGNAGEEIHTDELARVKVRLLFDHRKDTVAGMATWVRIAHAWAGSRWGWQHLPRVGTEVAVAFMNGDPDVPVVVGGFYHQDMPPVFPLPAEQTKQGFRSRSTLRGGTQDYSELSFDDRKGDELVFLHAQKDYRTEVEHDRRIEIGHDQSVTVKHDHSLVSRTGNINVRADAGAIDITAAQRITLRVGASTITLTPQGITITAPSVTTQATSVTTNAASVTTRAASVITDAASVTTRAMTVNTFTTAFQVVAARVVLATPKFTAPPPLPLP
ncbi:VgrG protein [Rhodovastum atsumiense]|uniref:Type VI secretion system tip protein VgrG n=1 Tax=Rhodovastum atsumiense TaxID=504468 RepID=A0A5M6IWK7_9PROT|nr:type VI secretion system tip protein TssI/VgrG [Rhodovastum atsumiense]KAA5612716.1 type VI secretion system tip protein VgrG [Rhodovastum atsumiense]CAH2602730.1 VgrG protein [Rhodovastum atsumiense]